MGKATKEEHPEPKPKPAPSGSVAPNYHPKPGEPVETAANRILRENEDAKFGGVDT